MRCGCFFFFATGSTQHVCDRERENGLLFIEMSLMAETAEKELVRDVSEKLCYIALDYGTEPTSTAEIDNYVTVDAKRFHCAEVWYQSSFTGKEANGSGSGIGSAVSRPDRPRLQRAQLQHRTENRTRHHEQQLNRDPTHRRWRLNHQILGGLGRQIRQN